MKNKLTYFLLILTAFLWGSSFAFSKMVSFDLSPYSFLFIRSTLAFMIFLILFFIKGKFNLNKSILIKVIISGVILGIAYLVLQYAFTKTTASKGGFIISTQIIIVPILVVFLKEKVKLKTWIGSIICLVGFFIMSTNKDFSINIGDLLIVLSALLLSFQVIICKKISKDVDPFAYGAIINLVISLISLIGMFINKDKLSFSNLNYLAILYVTIASSVLATIFQLVSQKNTNPQKAALFFSTQSIFSLISAFIVLKEVIKPLELIGCCIVLTGIVYSQMSFKRRVYE